MTKNIDRHSNLLSGEGMGSRESTVAHSQATHCKCGCGGEPSLGRSFITGHNLRVIKYKRAFSEELKQQMVGLFRVGNSVCSIARQLGKPPTSVSRILKLHGFHIRSGVRENHPNWKGGRIRFRGYWVVHVPNHPRTSVNRKVYEHIIVAEKKLGRFIAPNEPIHHIDLDGTNNTPSNLYVCTNDAEHQLLHISLDGIAELMVKQGIIRFTNGRYYSGQLDA